MMASVTGVHTIEPTTDSTLKTVKHHGLWVCSILYAQVLLSRLTNMLG